MSLFRFSKMPFQDSHSACPASRTTLGVQISTDDDSTSTMRAECVGTDREPAHEDFEALGAVLQFARQAKAKEEIQAENLHLEARMCFAFWRARYR
jgi:hypothetical protein